MVPTFSILVLGMEQRRRWGEGSRSVLVGVWSARGTLVACPVERFVALCLTHRVSGAQPVTEASVRIPILQTRH